MGDTATTGVIVDPSPFEVVIHSSSLIAKNEQSQQRPSPPPVTRHVPAAATVANTSEPATTLSDDRVVAVRGRPDLRDPTTFELRIRCRQVVEQFTTTLPSSVPSPINSSPTATITTPCRVKDSRVCVEHNHFINGTNVTPSVVQGQPVLTTLNVKDDQVVPKWSSYGVSSIEAVTASGMDSISPSCNMVWLNLQPNDLPPQGKYLNKRFLTHMILDFYWTTDSCSSLYDQLVQQQLNTQTIIDINNNATTQPPSANQEHSLETLAMQTGLDKILIILSKDQNQPLIFSPIRIRWFTGVMRDNKRIVDSLMGVYRSATCSETRDSMDRSFQRMRRQFPSVPQGNRYLLLETALETKTNTIVVAGPNLRRRLRSRRVVDTSVVAGTRARVGRDDVPGLNTDVEISDDMRASTNMALPFIPNSDDHDHGDGKHSDSNNDDDHEPSPQQLQLGRGTNAEQQEDLDFERDETCLQNVLDGQQAGARGRRGEPSFEHLALELLNMSSSDNNNSNKQVVNALVPDNSIRFITPATETSATAGRGGGKGGNAQKFAVALGGADLPRHMDMGMCKDVDMSSFDDFDLDRGDSECEMDDERSSIHASPLH